MIKFQMARDINGYNGFGLPFSDNKWQGVLTSATELTVTVPISPDATYPNILAVFNFQPGSMVWVAVNDVADVPSGSMTACNSESNPIARQVLPGDVLSFKTNDASDEVGVVFYMYKL